MYIGKSNQPRWAASMLFIASLLLVAGCAQDLPPQDPQAFASAQRYPDASPYGPDLDIVVVPDGSAIILTNRTAKSYNGLQLWINQQYMQTVDQIAIGANPQLPLSSFTNRYREPFPTGTFLQPEHARPVISVELYDPAANVRYRLTVQPDNQALRL